MRAAPFHCDRVRSQLSLQLDGELSQLERAMVGRHLRRCGECRAFQVDVEAFCQALRDAPVERMQVPVVVSRSRRSVAFRLQATAAAAVALIALGIGFELSASDSQQQRASVLPVEIGQIRYPSQRELEDEILLLQRVRSASVSQTTGRMLVR